MDRQSPTCLPRRPLRDLRRTRPDFPDDIKNERNVRLDRIAAAGDTFLYEYDVGDNWVHEFKVEKVLQLEPGVRYPRCLGGKRTCPPEEGFGYEDILRILRDQEDEEHEEVLEWLGGNFDPEAFDLDGVNAALRRIR